MDHLTICYYTSRKHPRLDWFFDSLKSPPQTVSLSGCPLRIVVVDFWKYYRDELFRELLAQNNALHVLPKPNVWQGEHRIPKEQWWAIANARNTGLCYAPDGWISWVDDRSVLIPTWFQALREAMKGGYAVAGAYEKRKGMVVEGGIIRDMGELMGADPRHGRGQRPVPAPGSWWFGGTSALPVAWALAVNGVDETCDGLGLEDNLFGAMLANNRFPIKYDPRMKVIEDRTPEQSEQIFRRTDKGVSPKDKSHALVDKLQGLKRAVHEWDITDVRRRVLAGEPFPIPTGPTHDWWDGQPLSEFV